MRDRGATTLARARLGRWGSAALATVLLVAALTAVLVLTRGGDDARAAGRSPGAARASSAPSTALPSPRPPSSSTATPSVVATPSPPPSGTARGSHATLPPVPLSAQAMPLAQVSARLASVRAVTAKSELPGETSGAALEVVAEVRNASSRPVDVSGGVVNLYLGKSRTPAVPTDTASTPFSGVVKAGGSALGTFVFRVRPGDGRQMAVELDLGAASKVVLFRGPRPQQGR